MYLKIHTIDIKIIGVGANLKPIQNLKIENVEHALCNSFALPHVNLTPTQGQH